MEFAHDVGLMRLYRLDTDKQLLSDALVGVALSDELENLPFPTGEQIVSRLSLPLLRLPQKLTYGDGVGDGRAEVGVTPVDRLDP